MRLRAALVVVVGLGTLAGCRTDRGPRVFLEEGFPEKLSEWRLFSTDNGKLTLNEGVHPFAVRTPLFSDYATKHRAMWVPPGKSVAAGPDGALDFPVGTVLAKTFSFPENNRERLIETRLLIRREHSWVAVPYVWNREGSDATLAVAGDFTTVAFRHPAGEVQKIDYAVPNVNQCRSCHDQAGDTVPLGTKLPVIDAATRARLALPAPAARPDTETVRAREYLDANCAHCHNPAGSAMAIPLDLRYEQTHGPALGVGKAVTKPAEELASARLVVVPGDPQSSALWQRMNRTDKAGMPTIGHSVVDREGVALIGNWIRGLKH